MPSLDHIYDNSVAFGPSVITKSLARETMTVHGALRARLLEYTMAETRKIFLLRVSRLLFRVVSGLADPGVWHLSPTSCDC